MIPIIFSISEDALSRHSLQPDGRVAGPRGQPLADAVARDLAVGQSGHLRRHDDRFWPGGGRDDDRVHGHRQHAAVGLSPFNGFRTLSANIAVEIPEAPVEGTLYRVLFLCAVLLFLLTFLLNTAAELVRQHLRKRYGRY